MRHILLILFVSFHLIECKEKTSTVHLSMVSIDSLDITRRSNLPEMKDEDMGITIYRSLISKNNKSRSAVDPILLKTGNDLWLMLSIYHTSDFPISDTKYKIVCDDTSYIIIPDTTLNQDVEIDGKYYSRYELSDYLVIPELIKSIALSQRASIYYSGNNTDFDSIRQPEKDACADIYYIYTGDTLKTNFTY